QSIARLVERARVLDRRSVLFGGPDDQDLGVRAEVRVLVRLDPDDVAIHPEGPAEETAPGSEGREDEWQKKRHEKSRWESSIDHCGAIWPRWLRIFSRSKPRRLS